MLNTLAQCLAYISYAFVFLVYVVLTRPSNDKEVRPLSTQWRRDASTTITVLINVGHPQQLLFFEIATHPRVMRQLSVRIRK